MLWKRVCCLALLVLPVGCRRQPTEPVHPVHGTATYRGVPMWNARISFVPTGDLKARRVAAGVVDEQGNFQLTTYKHCDGAPAGEYVVTIYWPGPDSQREDEGTPPDLLGGAYAARDTSPLRATVGKHPNEINFSLP